MTVRDLTAQMLALALATLAALAGSFWIGRGLSRRLERVTAEVEAVERSGRPGDLGLEVYGSDEVGVLAQAFRNMASELAAKRRVLKDTNHALRRDLRRQEDLLRQFASASDQVFWIYDHVERTFLFVNEAFEELSGRSPTELMEDPTVFFELFPPEDHAGVRELIARGQGGELLEAEHRIVDGSGGYKWVRLRTYPIADEGGEVTRIAGISEDVTEARRNQEVLRRKARIDPLTGISNRAALEEDLDRLWTRYARDGDGFCILYLDLDDFKPINDRYGHGAGDDVLVEVATRLREMSRPGDLVARLGGDEFVVVAVGLSGSDGGHGLASRVARAVARPICTRAGEVVVQASVGIAAAEGAASSADLLDAADRRIYRRKRSGSSRRELSA